MLINEIKSELREELLVEKYCELTNSGVNPSEILVLVQNSEAKKNFTEHVLKQIKADAIEKLNIHSFFSLVYNTISDNWCFTENSISSDKHFILPNLVGLEVSQFLLKEILKNNEVKGYNSKKSLLHQIFRRYSLIVQNDLSDDEVKKRSKILKEAFGNDAEIIIKKLLTSTLNFRSLDYLRQILIFKYICKNTACFKNIKYLIADDADEMTPACLNFIEYLKPQLKDWFVAFDALGSSRCGYLSADTSAEFKLKKIFNEEVKNGQNNFYSGDIIFSNILEGTSERLKNFTLTSLSKRAEILDYTIAKIEKLLKNNVSPNDIVIITPLQDDMLKFTLRENLKNCNLLFLSGSEKLIDNPLVKSSINLLKLIYGIPISKHDLKIILSDFAGIPLKYTKPILDNFTNTLPDVQLEFYNNKYQRLLKTFKEIKVSDEKLSLNVYNLFTQIVDSATADKINKFNFFIKEIRDFESVLGENTVKERASDIINQIENSIIAENPSSTLDILPDDIVVATPQKIIDNKISSKYQFWLDVSHSDWVKNDTGPLYNSWVMQSDWRKEEYTLEDDIYLSKQKTARILRKLLLLAHEHVWALSSLFDPQGVENLGGIESYLASENEAEADLKPKFQITPRNDQKPVLDYKKGSMAISAVPGAGKTTILLALIVKLMEMGTKPENIFILTYMDSAARNFRERIKNMCPDSAHLPNISTIHGLALRIIKENSNYERLGLDANFDICDDTQRLKILKSIQGKNTKKDLEDFDRAVSVVKLQQGSLSSETIVDKKLEKFKNFYIEYQKKLKEENLIDYDDILLLSVKLLEENKDILKYYQDLCEYVIEDEAQDSSAIQQKLIGLLSGKHKNIIRCGDINQAITTTFSNADVEGFRTFIKNAGKSVEMNCSQRCTQEVMNLANKIILWGGKILPKAFYNIIMQGVEGKNPVSKDAVWSNVFEKTYEEKNFIIKEIKNILTKDKNATIGILLRSNFQVASWTSFINNSGLKTITRSESLGQKAVFNTIFSILKFIQNPFDNEQVVLTYETLSEAGLYKPRMQLGIRACEKPFITLNGDEIESGDLSQFLWDMQYWLDSSTLPPEELVIRIGLFYYNSDIEKSNVYLIATLIKRLNSNNNFDLLLERLDALAKRPSLSGFKFFSEENDESIVKGKVQIMTMHKSKGDEFDYVFIPELSEKALSMDTKNLTLKASTSFMEEVRGFNASYKKKTETELKEFSAEENMRLFYVAVTRAKKKLYITTHTKFKTYNGGEKDELRSIIFDEIL